MINRAILFFPRVGGKTTYVSGTYVQEVFTPIIMETANRYSTLGEYSTVYQLRTLQLEKPAKPVIRTTTPAITPQCTNRIVK